MADDDGYRSLGDTVSDSRSQIDKGKADRKSDRGSAIAGGLSRLSSTEKDASDRASSNIHAVSYKRGGQVKRTGLARLHKNEYVVPRGKVKRVKKAMRRSGIRMKGR